MNTFFLRGLFGVILGAVLITGLGCRRDGGQAPDPRSPVDYFKEQQANVMVHHGKVRMDTVTEKDGKIEYKTEDGRTWRIGYKKGADGRYEFEATSAEVR